ncbi:E3 ISG15-- ligase HERC5 [Chlorella sorokiniana]|uniref:E3 ISG15--ligase HERC5 n=1 Tax=Chlorella sorokiniana TaxID=3076 RepID=A0A2P6TG75_CHLSO|nr:E3 ISG15-- ligase HERC5 [Chlorella sorokiniana]|eukprot:PRW33122.1 E3 ISG15-- ligase HERC5 [Chlorella sorokiniana]
MRRAAQALGWQPSALGARGFSVVAWGRNSEGQCGVAAYLPLLLQPREVEAFAGLPVASLAAAKAHSAGVLASGEVLTWGEGSDGKLGLGGTDSAHTPQFVQSLAGRVHVTGAALGRQHTLFLDSSGQAWATGENKEGQCGLGTPLEELARQQRQQWEVGAVMPWSPNAAAAGVGGAAAGGGGAAAAAAQQRAAAAAAAFGGQPSFEQQQFERNVEYFSQNSWQQQYLKPFVEHRERSSQLEAAMSMYDADLRTMVEQQSAWQRFEAAKGRDISIPGLMPGQIATPVRLGRARQGIFNPGVAELAGLDAERIVQLSAGRFMSAAVTAAGEVWTFGGGFNGELGTGASWSPGARRVEGILAQVLKDNGGAVKVTAGGSFCAALTNSGRVVLWGQPRGSEGMSAPPAAALANAAAPQPGSGSGRRRRGFYPLPRPGAAVAGGVAGTADAAGAAAGAAGAAGSSGEKTVSEEIQNMRIQKQGGVLVAEVTGLPPMKDVAAGFTHIAFTDGTSVWTVGRQGLEAASGAAGLRWLEPRRVLHRPDDGLASLAAGSFASAAITGDGELYLWGTVLSEDASTALLKQSESEGLGHWAYSSTSDPAAMEWSGWEGLGGPEPRLVPGLHKYAPLVVALPLKFSMAGSEAVHRFYAAAAELTVGGLAPTMAHAPKLRSELQRYCATLQATEVPLRAGTVLTFTVTTASAIYHTCVELTEAQTSVEVLPAPELFSPAATGRAAGVRMDRGDGGQASCVLVSCFAE